MRPLTLFAALLLHALLLHARSAHAQLLSEDVEDWPGDGGWGLTVLPGGALSASPEAAHRGARGLRLTEGPLSLPDGGAFSGAATRARRVLKPSSNDLYLRAWVRVSSLSGPVSTTLLSLSWRSEPQVSPALYSVWQYSVRPGASYCNLWGRLPDGGNDIQPVSCDGPPDGGWHLVEGAVTGRGQSSGSMAVDGTVVHARDFSSTDIALFEALELGAAFVSGPITLSADFDDVRADIRPQASRLSVGVSDAGLVAGRCAPVDVRLASTFPTDAGVTAPYRLRFRLSGAPHFADPACSDSTDGALEAGAEGAVAYTRVDDEGEVTLGAVQVPVADLLDAPRLTAPVRPAPPEPSYYSCASGPGALPQAALLGCFAVARAALRQRRRR